MLHYADFGMFVRQYEDIFELMKNKHHIHIMVFGVVTSDGDAMPLSIFPYSLTLNMEAYTKCL